MKELKTVFVVCGRIKQENAVEKPLLPVAMSAPKKEETPDELKSKWEASDILPPLQVNRQIRNLTSDSATGDSATSEVLIPMLFRNKNQLKQGGTKNEN